jgi:hypothetical protein
MSTEHPKRLLVDQVLHGRLDSYVLERRQAGDSWGLISARLFAEHHVRVTDRSLSVWYPDVPRGTDDDDERAAS